MKSGHGTLYVPLEFSKKSQGSTWKSVDYSAVETYSFETQGKFNWHFYFPNTVLFIFSLRIYIFNMVVFWRTSVEAEFVNHLAYYGNIVFDCLGKLTKLFSFLI